MSTQRSKNVALIIATIFLLLALIDGWPYGFFTLLRFVVCGTSAYVAMLAFDAEKRGYGWAYAALAVLFNPFVLITFERETWVVIDAIVAVFNLSSVWLFNLESSQSENSTA